MLTLPSILERAPLPYVAIRERVRIPFKGTIDRVMPELLGWLKAHGIEPAGAPFIKYNLIAMPDLEIEFGVPTAAEVTGDSRVHAGKLPAGKYASLTYWGSYEHLGDVNAVMIGWAKEKQLRWDAQETPNGDLFACRLEIYETDPSTEPDPTQWKTVLAIRLKD